MVKKIAFTMYPAKDLARARHFYEVDLGLRATETPNPKWIEFDLAGGCFALTTMTPGLQPVTEGAIAFEVDNVDSLLAELKSKGHRVLIEPASGPVCRMAIIADPEGNSVILHQTHT